MHTAASDGLEAGAVRMFELASTPRDLGEILVQGVRLGQLAFRRLFMLTSLLAFLSLVPTVCLVWGTGDAVISLTQMVDALSGRYGLSGLVVILLCLPIRALLLNRISTASRGQTEVLQEELRKALHAWPWLFLAGIVYLQIGRASCRERV